MNNTRYSLLLIVIFAFFIAIPVSAQDAPSVRPEQFGASATAVDGANLLTSRYLITLWGVEPVEASGTTLSLKARTILDNIIGGKPVQCEVKEWHGDRPVARCLNAQEIDLALAMIEAGYATVDRPAVSGSVFDVPYRTAETKAQQNAMGGWSIGQAQESGLAAYFNGNDQLIYAWLIGVLALPLLGVLFVASVLGARLVRLEKYLEQTIGEAETRQKTLREQERFVVASMIENELSANKGKLEAFIIIYNDLLKSLRQSKEHRYQASGEIVHDAPLLERTVFEGNLNRLDLLGPAAAGEIVAVYSHIQSNPNYTTLDASVPMDEAILKVQKVVSDAESLIPKMDKIIQSLHVTIRDKQALRSIRH